MGNDVTGLFIATLPEELTPINYTQLPRHSRLQSHRLPTDPPLAQSPFDLSKFTSTVLCNPGLQKIPTALLPPIPLLLTTLTNMANLNTMMMPTQALPTAPDLGPKVQQPPTSHCQLDLIGAMHQALQTAG